MDDPYADVRAHFEEVPDVTVSSGRGAQGIKLGGKMFAMFHKGELLLQFSEERVAELIASGEALAHDPGTGKPMKNRVLVPASRHDSWIALAEESRRFVESG